MTLEVGLLSTAHIHADTYASILEEHDDATLVGVTDPDRARGRDAAARYGIDYVADPETLLEQVDAGIICSPNTAHGMWVDRAVEYGVEVLCEKPLAPTVAEASEIVDTWRTADIQVGLAMPLRCSEATRRAEEALEAGTIGTVHSISGTNRGLMPGGWFVDPDLAGGGAVMDHTVHLVDLVMALTGESVDEVYAETATRFHDIAVEDVNVLSMRLTDGTGFLLDGSWSKPDGWHTWGDATLELVGTDGTISIDCTGESMTYTTEDDCSTVPYGMDMNAALLDDFLTAVYTDRPPITTPDAGLEAVAVVEAAYESAARGAPAVVDR